MDEILLNETQKVSAEREAPEFLVSDCNENFLYQVYNISLEETKDKLEWQTCVLMPTEKFIWDWKIKWHDTYTLQGST